MKAINNQMYNELADAWWDENGKLHLLKVMVNPWRVPYFAEALHKHFGLDLVRLRLLDIGCGGGVLAEEFARLGCRVTGIDLAERSLEAARAHADKGNLSIDYRLGAAENLEFDSSSFEVVSCCDVLEHIRDWRKVIAEASRVIKPGGLFFFDTINRTTRSQAAFIDGLQENPLTKLFPPGAHVWEMFITPEELSQAIEAHGMQLEGMSGSVMTGNPWSILWEVLRHKLGRTTVAELGRSLALKHAPDFSLNYLGYARKAGYS
ncbi:MAG: 3-demethylubiquinone-9 3-O-methyltransferase [Anaerolineales bacterium]|nr:3-demethylubiquinone-9 3-O-methyltransferase [Anaerolineales bacterium]